PDYVRYFRSLPEQARDGLVAAQWQLHRAISPETIAHVFDLLYERAAAGRPAPATLTPNVEVTRAARAGGRVELAGVERHQGAAWTVRTDRVVLATGYAPRRPPFLAGLGDAVRWDGAGRYDVDEHYRVALDPAVGGGLYVQNAEQHRNGVGTPDLGLGAHRSAVILNAVAGRVVHRLPGTSSFTTFGVA
ncbi:MAG: SidA/IucD/PvdA family monooxygenase, partial [Acidimicrobiia bacterium]